MTPFVADSDFTLYVGDVRDVLASLPDESVHCVVTSPPYWGLRDYGTGAWDGGEPDCDHIRTFTRDQSQGGTRSEGWDGNFRNTAKPLPVAYSDICGKCGARRVDQQLGLEPTPDAYVTTMVDVFREVRRVLRRDGTCWLNLGDSYAANRSYQVSQTRNPNHDFGASNATIVPDGLKPKDLVGIPWRVAFALQADGWCLRSDVVWSKPNPMPESVTDRPTKAHEMLFLLTKADWKGPPRSHYDDIPASDLRWIAGLLDCEGSIVIRREAPGANDYGAHAAQVSIGSTSRPLLERLAEIIGEGNVLERGGTNAPMFYWQTSGKMAYGLLRAVYPHLIVKQRQARCAIHLETLKYHRGNAQRLTEKQIAERDLIWEAVKSLNHFGDPDLSAIPEPVYGRWVPARYFYDADAIREEFEARPQQRLTANVDMPLGKARIEAGVQQGNPQGGTHVSRFTVQNETLICGCVEAGCGRTFDQADCGCACHRVCEECGGSYAHFMWCSSQRRGPDGRKKTTVKAQDGSAQHRDGERWPNSGRNARSVWEIATQPYAEAHFATFPEELARRCIAAGCPQDGVVLDPFMGSGTTALVARKLGRRSIGIELNPEYAELAARRLSQLSLLAEEVS
jgi:DNA modification methylase